jgi:DnaJ-class molecular chaperone
MVGGLVDCPLCQGLKKIGCPTCGGSGIIQELPGTSAGQTSCPTCQGNGVCQCTACQGTGLKQVVPF